LPRYFEFPSRGYTDRPLSEARAAYDKLARYWSGGQFRTEAETKFGETVAWQAKDKDEARADTEFDGAT